MSVFSLGYKVTLELTLHLGKSSKSNQEDFWIKILLPGIEEQEDFGNDSPGEDQVREAQRLPTPWPCRAGLSPQGRTRASHPWSETQSPTELIFCLRTQAPVTRDISPAPARLHVSVRPGAAASVPPVSLLAMQILSPTCRPTNSICLSIDCQMLRVHTWHLEVLASGKGIQAGTRKWEGPGYCC